MTSTLEALEPLAVPGAYPVPAGRGRWRLTLHRRVFGPGVRWTDTIVSELPHARGRRLEQVWNGAASATFTLNGLDLEAQLITELQHDLVMWRWDDTAGVDRALFRGVIGQSEDQLTEDSHTVTFTAHDYVAMLERRYLQAALVYTQVDQDNIVAGLVNLGAAGSTTSAGVSLAPGAYLPLVVTRVNPDGSARGALSGTLRDRTYPAGTSTGQALDDLAKVQGGYDYDVLPLGSADGSSDLLRIFYGSQGIVRADPVLNYGGNVATLTRAVNSTEYANYVRVIGNNGSADPAAVQLYSETRNVDATGTVVGLWSDSQNASDVTIQSTLDQRAAGALTYEGTLLASYTVKLAPDWYFYGAFNMGDTVTLAVQSGRLNVSSPVRVVGIAYDIGDDGDENVGVTLGRPVQSLARLLTASQRDVDALARR